MNNESRIVRVETVIEHINFMLERTDKRFDKIENDIAAYRKEVNGGFDTVNAKIDSTTKWLIGIGLSSFVSVIGIIVNIAMKLH